MRDYFKNQYYFNASHSSNRQSDKRHTHTFSMTLYMEKDNSSEFLPFYMVDGLVKAYLQQYEGCYLDDLVAFQKKGATIENMGDFFYEELRQQLEGKGIHLLQLEMSETPVRVYCVSDCILLAMQYGGDSKRRWEQVLEVKQRLV